MAASIIGVAMAIFQWSMIHASQGKATDPDQRRDPLAQAVLLAFSDPLAKEAEGRPGWQICLADDATRLRWHVRPTDRRPESPTLAR
ncbi:MAG: hypothetical protein ABWY82_04685 [Tardiphaga sp.]